MRARRPRLDGYGAPTETEGMMMAAYSAKYGPTDPVIGNWYRVEPLRILAWTEAAFPADATCFEP